MIEFFHVCYSIEQSKTSMVLRSSRKWHIPKKKLGGIVIKDSNFEIKSDGSHCYYLFKKKK